MDDLQRPAEQHVVSDLFDSYNETQRYNLAVETRKTSYKLFSVAVVLLLFNILTLSMIGIPLSKLLFPLLLFPVIFTGLGILAFKEPLAAISLGMLVMFGTWIYLAVTFSTRTLLQGWLGKAIIVYLLFAGLQNAQEAHRIRKELKS